jgi:MFS transporter, DHA1 family, multidrug resistance protein
MASFFRETAAGQLIRLISRNKLLQYPEEKPDFQLPSCWVDLMNGGNPQSEVVQDPVTGTVARVGAADGADAQSISSSSSSSSSSSAGVSPTGSGRGERQEESKEKKDMDRTASDESGETETETEKESNGLEQRRSSAVSKGRTNSIATVREELANRTSLGLKPTKSRVDTIAYTNDRLEADEEQRLNRTKTLPIVPQRGDDGSILVDWYYTDDPENPQNWSDLMRANVTLLICVYTFVVYMSSAIYTTSELGVIEEFGVSETRAALGLSIFVLGYGTGPLIFSPLSELASIGRNPIYIITTFLFVIVSIPAALPHNYEGLMVLRFLQGFFGSPCLANGGASVGDMYSLMHLPYALIAWVSAAYCGPALGPLLSGFSVPAEGWRWSLLEILWASAPIFVAMFFLLPETSQSYILLHRARRLRKLTGDNRFMSQSEINQRNLKPSAVLMDALIKPIEITIKDPAILFVQIYTAIIYGIYYR